MKCEDSARRFARCGPRISKKGDVMKKSLMAIAAAATLAVSVLAAPQAAAISMSSAVALMVIVMPVSRARSSV